MNTDLPLRSQLAAGCLLLGPLGLGVGGVVRPEAGDDGASLVDAVTADPERWALGNSLVIVSAGLMLIGLAHLASRLPHRARLASFGLALAGAGALGHAALAATELVLVPLSGGTGAAAAVDRINESSELGIVFLLYLPGILIGGLLLFAGLWRSGVLPRWAALVGLLAVLFGFFGEKSVPGGDLLTAALTVAALLPVVLLPQAAQKRVGTLDSSPLRAS